MAIVYVFRLTSGCCSHGVPAFTVCLCCCHATFCKVLRQGACKQCILTGSHHDVTINTINAIHHNRVQDVRISVGREPDYLSFVAACVGSQSTLNMFVNGPNELEKRKRCRRSILSHDAVCSASPTFSCRSAACDLSRSRSNLS